MKALQALRLRPFFIDRNTAMNLQKFPRHPLTFGPSPITPLPRLSAHLGWQPQDNTEAFRAPLEAKHPLPDPKAPAVKHLGGWFVDLGHPDDEATK